MSTGDTGTRAAPEIGGSMENYSGAGPIRSRKRLRGTLFSLPNDLLGAKGNFLGDKSEKRIKTVAILRSGCGILVLATVALTYPGYTASMSELVQTHGGTPAGVVSGLKLTDSLLTTTLYGFGIFLLCVFLFAVPIIVLTRSGNRLAMLRHMCIPLGTFALFAGLMGLIVGAADLLNLLGNALNASTSNMHNFGSFLAACVELITLAALFLVLVPILAVWYVKAIYLAAFDVFRSDDAHPLLAPFANDGGVMGARRDWLARRRANGSTGHSSMAAAAERTGRDHRHQYLGVPEAVDETP